MFAGVNAAFEGRHTVKCSDGFQRDICPMVAAWLGDREEHELVASIVKVCIEFVGKLGKFIFCCCALSVGGVTIVTDSVFAYRGTAKRVRWRRTTWMIANFMHAVTNAALVPLLLAQLPATIQAGRTRMGQATNRNRFSSEKGTPPN